MTMTIRDFRTPPNKPQGPRIIGAQPIDQIVNPEILDRSHAVEGTPVEVRVHQETVIESDKVRSTKRETSDPEVRVRIGNTKEWENVKRGEDA
jgi:hypothetical protein